MARIHGNHFFFTSSVTLLALVLFYTIVLSSLLFTKHAERTIKLKDGPRDYQTRKGLFSSLLLDNIDDDLGKDGEPVDLPAFWREVIS
jgi:hypothetical protein